MLDVKGYEGLYGVTKDGKVYSYISNKFLKPGVERGGYLCVILCKNGKKKHYKVHRLVAMTYIENPNNYPHINHKDEDKTNNNVSNLEWCTAKYNNNYGTKLKRQAKSLTGYKHTEETKRKMSESRRGEKNCCYGRIGKNNPKYGKGKKIQCIETGQIFDCIADASEYITNDRKKTSIGNCCKGKTKTAYGYHWKYIN